MIYILTIGRKVVELYNLYETPTLVRVESNNWCFDISNFLQINFTIINAHEFY